MKKVLIAFCASLITSAAFAAASTCETYAAMEDVPYFKVTESATDTLSDLEKGMIQTTILVGNPGQPMTVEQAIAEFSDSEFGGSNAGSLVYSKITVGTKIKTVARVTYYPGDNEYGILFQLNEYQNSTYIDMLGTIQDGEVICLQ